ncbi:MAG: aminotransferase class V-fold PLP-dependent enzyme [Holosporaceae bacterium]|nr:aminotransferase class V-fold PLP-dependent enzyme [Holosporaceae bacterium]
MAHEDPSTEATQKLPKERMFRKKSIEFLLLLMLATHQLAGEDKDEVIYFDAAASLPINQEALREFMTVAQLDGNSSGINPHAKHLEKIEKQAAQVVADKINGQAHQIHFCSSATMANNMAILGVARKNPGCHLITSKIEHKSVLNVFRHLEKNGHEVTYLNVDRRGSVDLEHLRRSIRGNTKLISVQMLNSETGTLQDLKTIGKISRHHKILLHTDAAQAFGKCDIDVDDIGIDLVTMAGHKIGAPKGIAALYIKDSSRLSPILFGSGDDFFPGSKPTELIAAFAVAVKNFQWNRRRIAENFAALGTELAKIDKVYIIGHRLPPEKMIVAGIMLVSVDGVLLVDVLEGMRNYSFSAGCSCGGQERSNVLEAIDPEDKLPSCIIRISFSDTQEPQQLIDFAQQLKRVVEQLRREKSITKGCQQDPAASAASTTSSYHHQPLSPDTAIKILAEALKERKPPGQSDVPKI